MKTEQEIREKLQQCKDNYNFLAKTRHYWSMYSVGGMIKILEWVLNEGKAE